jgi:hypothetical protein
LSRYEETFNVLDSLKEELFRLRRIEQEYRRLSQEYEALLKHVEHAEKIRAVVKPEEGFYFCTDDGVYTEYSALNLEEFNEALKNVPMRSIEYHMARGDFKSWLKYIGTPELAKEFEEAKALSLSGESLRSKLVEIIEKNFE